VAVADALVREATGTGEDGGTELEREHPDAARSTNVAAAALSIALMLAAVPDAPPRRMSAVQTFDLTPRRAADSAVTISQLMELVDANIAGNVHGGTIMKLVDTAAALAAIRHAGGLCVTVTVDELSFLEPVHIGEVVTLRASVNDVGTTSLECGVRVDAENPVTGRKVHASSAYLVFVAIDDEGLPRPVPPLLLGTDEERRRQREAKLRREARMAHKEAVKKARAAAS
jgi:uncharacterized protein (TIGR00369 family)